MQVRTTSRYLFILLLSLAGVASPAFAQVDTAATEATDEDEPTPRKKYVGGHQLTLGVDVFHPVISAMAKNRSTYEGEVSWYLKKNEYYLVAEGGWGSAKADFPDLKYNTDNYFGRIGFNKSVLYRESERDWNMMFIGLRAAAAGVSRGAASYVVYDSVWGSSMGTGPAKNFSAVWAEFTTGMRVDVAAGLMAGWNVRGKFMMNARSFSDLAPLHIAGFGRGDKNSSFDFNFYLVYAFRWARHDIEPPAETKKPAAK